MIDFKNHLKKYLPENEINLLIESFNQDEKKAVYLNNNKIDPSTFKSMFPNVKPHPVVPNGFIYNKNEYDLGKKIYHEVGAYYIQEPSAMLVAHLLNANKNDLVLDLCAAPGGKTIQTALKMENEGMIIANDLSKERTNILLSNIERLGIGNTVITSLDFSKQYDKFINFFDKIILDAPCSGSGMFRKSEEMKNDWTYEKVLKNAKIQKELITVCYKMLKEGGTMVYSTCSYSYEEDEEVIEFLLKNTDAKLVNIPTFEGEYRSPKFKESVHLFPSHFEGEGHYICLIQKPDCASKNQFESISVSRLSTNKGGNKEVNLFKINHKLPKHFDELSLRPGLFIETKVDNRAIPSHHYSHYLSNGNLIILNEEETIKYLQGNTLNKNIKDGYYFVAIKIGEKNAVIGVVHAVNNVLKNLYPKGLRHNSTIAESF